MDFDELMRLAEQQSRASDSAAEQLKARKEADEARRRREERERRDEQDRIQRMKEAAERARQQAARADKEVALVRRNLAPSPAPAVAAAAAPARAKRRAEDGDGDRRPAKRPASSASSRPTNGRSSAPLGSPPARPLSFDELMNAAGKVRPDDLRAVTVKSARTRSPSPPPPRPRHRDDATRPDWVRLVVGIREPTARAAQYQHGPRCTTTARLAVRLRRRPDSRSTARRGRDAYDDEDDDMDSFIEDDEDDDGYGYGHDEDTNVSSVIAGLFGRRHLRPILYSDDEDMEASYGDAFNEERRSELLARKEDERAEAEERERRRKRKELARR
ncbi:hypothetical protein H9P43_010024 [Blastocladiella emersonii ATCC 22665]|nr:hypothetical protein H9P43_010024 [Blastocladiella emersonii ATCC 22665]